MNRNILNDKSSVDSDADFTSFVNNSKSAKIKNVFILQKLFSRITELNGFNIIQFQLLIIIMKICQTSAKIFKTFTYVQNIIKSTNFKILIQLIFLEESINCMKVKINLHLMHKSCSCYQYHVKSRIVRTVNEKVTFPSSIYIVYNISL